MSAACRIGPSSLRGGQHITNESNKGSQRKWLEPCVLSRRHNRCVHRIELLLKYRHSCRISCGNAQAGTGLLIKTPLKDELQPELQDAGTMRGTRVEKIVLRE